MSGQPWEDRRGIFQSGKAVHEPGRKVSNSGLVGGTGSSIMDNIRRLSTSSSTDASLVDKPLSNDPQSPGSPTSQRRRSSAAGKFGSLQQHKRGSEDYAARRESWTDQMASGGIVSGWFNSTFRGTAGAASKKPEQQSAPGSAADQKRGVME